jgi:ADP-ribosyl-[dinitrogen reductase] hydrolase
MRTRTPTADTFRGALLGLAVGDAVGTTVEFKKRGTFTPLTDMVGGGPFKLAKGEWTDDTSMALCLAASLLNRDGFDARDQMTRYRRWQTDGYMSSNGRCFDIGDTIRAALDRFARTGDPFAGSDDPTSAGNGSIMRLAPIPLFFFPDLAATEHHAAESSRTTHGAPEAVDACRLLSRIIHRALVGGSKENVALGDRTTFKGSPAIVAMARGDYLSKSRDHIRGTGYVVDSLEAALWCFMHTDSFEAAILAAANLGDDADTTAAVCGQIAGAFYGETGIPESWLTPLAMRQEITVMADGFWWRQPIEG